MNEFSETMLLHLKKLNVLFVDDEKTVFHAMETVMSNLYRKTFFAQNGVEGLSLAIKYKIDMVITDISMPSMDGIEMVRAIERFHPEIKTIFITGHSDIDLNELANFNCQLVTKPINYQKLSSAIEKVL